MNKKTRATIFFSAIAVFIFVGFGVVMMSLGYGYDFANGRVVKTGALAVSTNTNAKIFINDNERGSTSFIGNSFSETRLLPGIYSLRVEAEGRQPWQKNIEIKESLLTEFPSIFLPLTETTPQMVSESVAAFNSTPGYLYKKNNFIYYLSQNQLISYDLELKKIKVLLKKVKSFSAEKDKIIYLTTDNKPNEYSIQDGKITALSLGETITNIRSFQTISGLRYAVLGNDVRSDFYILGEDKPEKIADNIDSFRLSPDQNKILLWNEREIFVYYLKEKNSQPYKEPGEIDLITRTTRRIYDINWFKDSEHILIHENRSLVFSEIDTRDQRNSYTLIDTGTGFYYDRDAEIVYVLNEKEVTGFSLK